MQISNPISYYIFHLIDLPLILKIVILIFGCYTFILLFNLSFKSKIMPIFILAYLGAILLWPWPPFRFFIPIMPLLFPLFLQDAYHTLRNRFPPFWGKMIAMAGVIFILFINGISYAKNIIENRKLHYPGFYAPLSSQKRPEWKEFQKLFAWIKENTREDDLLPSGMDTMLYLYTGRKALRPIVANPIALFYQKNNNDPWSAENFRETLFKHNVGFLVLCPMFGFPEGDHFWDMVVKIENAGYLSLVYQNGL